MNKSVLFLFILTILFITPTSATNYLGVISSTTNRSYNNTEVGTLSTTFIPILNITPPHNVSGVINVCFYLKEENTGLDSGQAYVSKNNVQIGTTRDTTGTYMQYCEDISTILNTTDTLSISADASFGVAQTFVKDMFLGYDSTLEPGVSVSGSPGGGAWVNTTMYGMRARQGDGKAVMNFTIQDYLDRYEFLTGSGSAIYDENITSNKGGTLFSSTWNATSGVDFDGVNDYLYFPSGAQPYQNGDWTTQTYWTIGFRAMNRDTNATGANYALYLDARPIATDILFLRTSPASTMATRGYRNGVGNDKTGTYTWVSSEIANWSIQSNRTNNITYIKNNSVISSNHSVGTDGMHFNNLTVGAGYNFTGSGYRFAYGKITIYDIFFFGRELNFSEMEEVSRKKIVTSGNMSVNYNANVSKISIEAITSNAANYTVEYKNGTYPNNWTTLITNWTGNSSFLIGTPYNNVTARFTCYTPNQSYNDCVVKAFYFTPTTNISSYMNTMTEDTAVSGITNQQFDNIKFNITTISPEDVRWYVDGVLTKSENVVTESYLIKNWDTTGYKTVKVNFSGVDDTTNVTWNVTINAQSPPYFNQTLFPYIDNFENMSEWSDGFFKTQTHKVNGTYSGRFEYSTVPTNKTLSTNISNYSSLNVSVYADNSQNTIYFRFGNSTDNYKIPYYLNNSQWNNITLHFSSAIITGNPNWRNISNVSILSDGTGVIYIDDMYLNPNGTKLSLAESAFADYYGWYHTPNDSGYYMKWSDSGHNPPLDIAMTLYPWHGLYDSTNYTQEVEKIKWVNQSGIKVIAYEWWDSDSRTFVGLNKTLNASANNSVKVFIFLDDRPAPSTGIEPSTAIAAIRNIYDTYSNYSAFYRDTELGNRPIFDIYISNTQPTEEWASNLSQLRGTKYDSVIICDNMNTSQASASGCDSLGDYYSIIDSVDISEFIAYQDTHKKPYVATVSPGFNNTRVGGTAEVNRSSNASRYENYFNNMTYKYGATRIQIVSFNEEMEGSGIIPYSPNGEVSNETPPFAYFNYTPHPPTYFLDKTHQIIANYSGVSVPLLNYYGNNKTDNYTTNVYINGSENTSFYIVSNRSSNIRWYINDSLQTTHSNVPSDTKSFFNHSFPYGGINRVQTNASNASGTTATMEWIVYVNGSPPPTPTPTPTAAPAAVVTPVHNCGVVTTINNTNLAPTIEPSIPGTGERILNVTYYTNDSEIDLHVFAHASSVAETAGTFVYINGTLVSPRAGRPLGGAEVAYRGVDIAIPRGAYYNVSFQNYHHYEWREYNKTLDISGCTYPDDNDSLNSVIMSLAFVIGLLVAFIVCLICQKRRRDK